jgi:hypothetical protein
MSGLRGKVSNSKEERMRKIAAWVLVLGMAMSPAVMAADGNDKTSDAKTDKSSTNTAKPSTAPTSTELEAEIEQLRALIKEQADQLAAMKATMNNGSTANAGTTNSVAANSVPASSSTGTSSNMTTASAAAPSSPTMAAGATPAAAATATAVAQDNGGEHSPLAFKIGDALFTPGGFMDFTGVFRTTGTGNGIGTTFSTIPFNNNFPTAGTNETRFSAQNSRISLKVDAPAAGGNITGYVEADFLGLIAANANQTSNSDSFRMRVYFGDYRRGKWEVLAGQDWSMLTPSRKGLGVMPADVFFSQNEDTNYQVGLPWTRQPQFRVMYHPNDQWTMGVSVENPDELLTTNVVTPTAFGPFNGQLDVSAGSSLATPPTPNYMPDIIVKVAHDHMFGDKLFHIEASGIFSEFRVFTPSAILGTPTVAGLTNRASGGGGSVNMNLELYKGLHLIANSFFSDGEGRYLLASGPDLVIKQLTTTSPFLPSLVHAYSGIGGLEYQATKKTLLDFYYGADYYGRNVQVNPVGGLRNIGYGFAGSAGTNNRIINEYTVGWTQTLWGSPNYGNLKIITQGSYLNRTPWAVLAGQPKDAHLFMAYVDLRYTLP